MSTELTPKPDVARPDTFSSVVFTPRVDILETDNELVLLADLPGVRPDDMDIRFEKGQLLLHGRYPQRPRDAQSARTEYGVGDYYRAFTIREDIDPDRIAAELKNGELTVHLPKAEKPKPRRIPVQGH
jgi:HSP20 family protein